jgi:acyl carrier protein
MESDMYELVVNEIAATMDIPAASLHMDSSLAEIGMDSLEALQLMVSLEQATQVQLEEQDVKTFTTVQSIVDLLNQRRKPVAA